MDTNQLAAPYGWELATDANGNQRLVPAYDSPFVGAYGALIDAPAGRIGPGFEPAASYGSFISPAALAALAKARAATGLPAGMAEHAGAAGIPANVNPSKAALVDQVAREAVADESATRDATSATAPAAAAPTAPAQASPGFSSGLFKDPYAGMSPKQMNEAAQRMQSAGDEYGANVLTQRADNAITSSDGSFAQGGSVDENHPVVQRAMHLVRSFLLNG